MTSSPAPGEIQAERILRGLVSVFSVLFVLLFVWVAWRRLHYPFEVDRMESGMMTSVWRLRHGQALYAPPSLSWAPFLYAPLFFYLSAAMTHVLGVQYAALRLVSILSTLGSFAIIFLFVYGETQRRWRPALFAVGVFASLYPFVYAWYDVGRVDSLSVFFFLAALWATRRTHPALAAGFWLLAFLTKQTFLPLGLVLFLVEWRRPVRMLSGMAAYAVLAGLSVAVLQHRSHGWFVYYAFGTTGVIKWSMHTAVMFPFSDLLAPLPVVMAIVVGAAFTTGIRWRERAGSFYAIITVLVTGAIWFVRAHVGANLNAVIPLYAWMAILSGVALDRLLAQAPWTPGGPLAYGQPHVRATALWLLCLVQLGMHLYRPAELQTGNLAARVRFLNAVRATPGDVWLVDHSYDAILAGKAVHADMDAFDAVLGRGYSPAVQEVRDAFAQHAFSAVVLDRVPDAYEPKGLFSAAPFASTYALRAVAPGGGAPGEVDQPMFTLLPCAHEQARGSLGDLSGALVDSQSCGGAEHIP